ncbi:MAG: PilZ domain-containing protein [Armatimonadetes bacterium]|nr:PilZ domain-containing protein [Armatimonadota bacterium]
MSSEPEVAEERRQTPRRHSPVNKILLADLVVAERESVPVYVFVVDVSSGGIRINVDRELPDGETLELSLPVEGFGAEVIRLTQGRATLRVQVVWKKMLLGGTWVHGLRFVDLDEATSAAVDAMMEAFSPSGRRMRFRLNRLLPVAIKTENGHFWIERFATDLSPEGLGVQLDAPLPEGQDVLVKIFPEFDLPVVQARARVAWTQETPSGKCKMGLRFSDIEAAGAEVIQRYIDRCLKLR